MSYFVYIITNKRNGTLYTGMTNYLSRRIEEHKLGIGSGFVSKYQCNLLVYAERFENLEEAFMRERSLKRHHRKWKLELIETMNTNWDDLSNQWL
ncbi:MAG: GIY-YIG nuclease family protein [Pseudomonadota bacterium]